MISAQHTPPAAASGRARPDGVESMQRWRWPILLFAVAVGLSVLVYRESWSSMAWTWLNIDTYNYGLIVPCISAWLVFRDRHRLRDLSPRMSLPGVVLVLTLATVWSLGELAGVLVVQHLVVVAMIPALALTFLGRQVVATLAFPLLYLLFAVPVGESLVPSLIQWTADFTVAAVEFLGVPVYQDGPFIRIPAGDFHVVKACSGIRYLLTSIVLGVLYAHLSYRSTKRKAAFLAICVFVPIVANWLRATGIIMLAHASDMRLAAGVDHLIYGWVFFGFVTLIIFYIGSRFTDNPPASATTAASGSTTSRSTQSLLPSLLALSAVSCLLLGSVAVPAILNSAASADAAVGLPDLPAATGGWRSDERLQDDWVPVFTDADQVLRRDYTRRADTVSLYVAHYRRQIQGAELVGADNSLFGGSGWWIREVTEIDYGADELRLRELNVTDGRGRSLLIWSWYSIGGHDVVGELAAKLATFRSLLVGDGSAGSVLALATWADEDPGMARRRLTAFLDEHFELLQRCIAGDEVADCPVASTSQD